MTSTLRWVVSTLVASLALAVGVFPSVRDEPAAATDPFQYDRDKARERYQLQSELLRRAHSRELARAAVARSAVQPAAQPVSAHPGGEAQGVIFVRTAGVTAAFEDRVRDAMRATRRPPRTDPGTRVVVVLVADTGQTLAGTEVYPGWSGFSTDVFAPGTIGDGACIVVARTRYRELLLPGASRGRWIYYALEGDFDAPCAWYGAYGTPGRGVASWLDSTQLSPVTSRGGRRSFAALSLSATFDGRSITTMPPAVSACMAGRVHTCEALILVPEVGPQWYFGGTRIRTPGWAGLNRYGGTPINWFATTALLSLERELGAETFAAFWKSDDPLPVAFAAARGESLDSWAGRLFRGTSRAYHAGPLPTRQESMAWLVVVPALLGIGVFAVGRRSGFA